ncbi:RNA-directed DNA polymerase, eukaryota, reverse transcriptase zinc-binding domain protein [Tanacetum coccineum]
MNEWIMTCVTSAAFSVCVNGERHGYLKSGRGLRQGDSMSPYIFTLVMEVLTLMVQRKVRKNYKSVEVLKDGLMEFSKSSGLVPNMSKSPIFFGSVKEIDKRRILEVIPFSIEKLPMKYLGVPLITKNIGIAECNQLVERVKQKGEIKAKLKKRNWDNDWLNVVADIENGGCKNSINSILERIAIVEWYGFGLSCGNVVVRLWFLVLLGELMRIVELTIPPLFLVGIVTEKIVYPRSR